MYRPKLLQIQNLFTHANTVHEFKPGVMTMLLGINNTEAGSDSNGSGKSSLAEAITLACTGEVARGVKKEDFIRHGQNNCYVGLILENLVLNEAMLVERWFYLNKSSKVRITVNEEAIFDSERDRIKAKDPNRVIFDRLGISEDDFVNYFVLGQDNSYSFFTAGDAKQKEVIARFSNYTQLDAMIVQLQANIKELEDEVGRKHMEEARLIGPLELLEEEKKTIVDDFEEAKKLAIKECGISITEITEKQQAYKLSIKEVKTNIQKHKDEATRLTELLGKLNTVEGLKEKIQVREDGIGELEKEIRVCKRRLGELENLTGQAIECPACKKTFIPNCEQSPSSVKMEIKHTEAVIKEAKETIATQQASIENLETKLENIRETKAEVKQHNTQRGYDEERLEQLTEYVSNCQDLIDKEMQNLQVIKDKTVDEQVAKMNQKIESYKEQLEIIGNEVEKLSAQISTNRYYEFHFGKKGFKTFLANKSIRNIQDLCNFYLKKFDTDMQVLISGYTTLKNGDMRDKIEVHVLHAGRHGLFKKYSGGEKSRVNVCGIITIHKLINNSCEYGKGLDLLCMDETVDYLDQQGYIEVIKILGKLDVTSILIMHQVADVPYPHKVIVVKENGISRIIEQ